MSWQQWLLVAYFMGNVLLNISYVGKAQKVITPGVAAFATLLSAGLILVVVSL